MRNLEGKTVVLKAPEGKLVIARITDVGALGSIRYYCWGCQGYHPTGSNIIKEVPAECFDLATEAFRAGGWTGYRKYIETL